MQKKAARQFWGFVSRWPSTSSTIRAFPSRPFQGIARPGPSNIGIFAVNQRFFSQKNDKAEQFKEKMKQFLENNASTSDGSPIYDSNKEMTIEEQADMHVSIAQQHLLSRNYEKALVNYNSALKLTPDDVVTMLNRALVLDKLKLFEQAIEDCEKVIEVEGKSKEGDKSLIAEANLRIGLINLKQEKYKLAQKHFEKAEKFHFSETISQLVETAAALSQKRTPHYLFTDADNQGDPYYSKLVSGKDIAIRWTTDKGRGLFATKNFSKGDVIFEEKPLISANISDTRVCENCFQALPDIEFIQSAHDEMPVEKFNELFSTDQQDELFDRIRKSLGLDSPDPRECPKCEVEQYCSPKCREEALNLNHKTLCAPSEQEPFALLEKQCIENLETEKHNHESIFVAQTLAALYQNPNSELAEHIKHLCHVNYQHTKLSDNRQKELAIIQSMFPKEFSPSEKKFLKLKSILNLNTISYQIDSIQVSANNPPEFSKLDIQVRLVSQIGVESLFGLASYLNHACSANVVMRSPKFNTNQIKFVADRDIKKGEELTISYIVEPDKNNRREALLLAYLFWCKCPACQNE